MLFDASGGSSSPRLDAGEPRREHRGERQVGVARRVGRAVLDPRRLLLAGLVLRHAHERAAVAPRPADVDRRLEPGHEPLVRVHPLVRDERDLGRVAQQRRRCTAFAVVDRWYSSSASKNALRSPSNSDWCVCIPLPFTSRDRLRHERRVDAELVRDLLHRQAVGHHVVGHRQRVGVAQVDLVLARRDLVVHVLDRDAHRLEVLHRALAVVGRDVERRLVEVAALIEERRVVDRLEVEVLELRADVERVAEVGGALELPLQHAARVAVERRRRRARRCRRTSARPAARSSTG